MSIPLDRLYHFLCDVSNRDNIQIYRFFPHGSKKVHQCNQIQPYSEIEKILSVPVFCHDQEPLDVNTVVEPPLVWVECDMQYRRAESNYTNYYKIFNGISHNIYHDMIMVHSEKHSKELQKIETQNVVGVYFWSHAVIALDWYRYAQHDQRLQYNLTEFSKDFLIYNRAWSGTREYRLKFAELLIENQLHRHCEMKFNEFDNNVHYHAHKFTNQNFSITTELEQYFEPNRSDSGASADYDSTDYVHCGIEVVLETLFDDRRWHLTEKSLRPMACGKPFILVGTPGSLEYLREYGFETFGNYINEDYDNIQDPVERLQAVITVMKSIADLDQEQKQRLFQNLHAVARRNQQRFFSKDFFNTVIDEFRENLDHAVDRVCRSTRSEYYLQWLQAHQTQLPIDSQQIKLIEQILNTGS